MSAIENLSSSFMKFPGIGTRQAKRFVYFLLAQDPRFLEQIIHEISELQTTIAQCSSCFRFYPRQNSGNICGICAGDHDSAVLLVVEKDTDFESVRRSGSYAGKYFILGGAIPVLEPNPDSRIRIRELMNRIKEGAKEGLSEVILALSANPEGDFTREYVAKTLTPLAKKLGIAVTALGRGLSTGSELEYSDSETLKYALKNRS
ncbi:MAG: toprim domain-containing protein [Candidatus Pacebacteria bacterium]|nr:toprim domain-containing protein [Candidatus Paceibacterota bacterium]